ncbi:hypothetical protein AACH06_21500 [Ideonella sp. DXS29W]|uniref:Uncharacterized protein n=1 Tax=Ideonella lacteola TaxID=2984193 RepID=A0ABU9BY81_9BURK
MGRSSQSWPANCWVSRIDGQSISLDQEQYPMRSDSLTLFAHTGLTSHSAPAAALSAPMSTCYEVRFRSLFHAGRGVTFPCDADGQVLLEGLSERARSAYHRARALVGSEYAVPEVQRCHGR